MKIRLVGLTFILPLLVLLTACGGGDSTAEFTNEEIQSEENGAFLSANEITVSQPDLGIYSFLIDVDILYDDIKGYKITYVTTHPKTDRKIEASGLLLIPKKETGKKSPILSYQHGTHFKNSNIPSNNPSLIPLLAGTGFIVAAPDYIGYGASAGQSPTYIHGPSYVNAGIDMLRATKIFLADQQVEINDQLFLAGYSEGGYATLAIQKAIQEDYGNEFTVTASAPGAGPYDLIETAKVVATKDVNESPAFMSFVLKTYDDIYDLNAVSEMYQPDYVNAINTVFNGVNSGGEITSSLTTNTSDLFTPLFLATLRGEQGGGNFEIMDKMDGNSIYDWMPTAPTRLFHGKNDEVVPYENTEHAYDAMSARGANLSKQSCEALEFIGTDSHVTCAVEYIADTVGFFEGYDPELK